MKHVTKEKANRIDWKEEELERTKRMKRSLDAETDT
jgi:hypothetical protein